MINASAAHKAHLEAQYAKLRWLVNPGLLPEASAAKVADLANDCHEAVKAFAELIANAVDEIDGSRFVTPLWSSKIKGALADLAGDYIPTPDMIFDAAAEADEDEGDVYERRA
jgi:hypothetical protein